uniref:Uncharacterized protein n=1 Tax=Mycena chlorophos TaxID=658473 RepID=A0ABQ0M0M8_MYCCL|nr:predicted protein [Mycena chlorophos]
MSSPQCLPLLLDGQRRRNQDSAHAWTSPRRGLGTNEVPSPLEGRGLSKCGGDKSAHPTYGLGYRQPEERRFSRAK